MRGRSALVTVIAAAALAVSWTAAAAPEKNGEKSTPSATKAPKKAPRIAVFPLEGINVEQRILDASSEILSSALINAGFVVADWKAGFVAITGEDPDVPPPPPDPPPTVIAPLPPELSQPAPEAAPEPVPQEAVGENAGETKVVEHATPPAALPGYRRVVVPARPSFPPRVAHPVPASTAPAMVLRLRSDLKAKIAEEIGCDYYVDGKLVLLGTKIRVTIEMHNPAGDAIDAKVMEGRTEDDLLLIYERVAVAFASDSSPDDTLTLDNATRAEALRDSNRFRLEKNFGATIGETFSFSEHMSHYTMIGFNGRLEMRDVMIDIIGGLGIGGDGDPKAHFMAGVGLGYYLTHSSISPYLGAGFGIFAGRRVDAEGDDDDPTDYESDEEDVAVGFEIAPVLGIEFMRHSSIRVHMDLKYSFSIVTDSRYGHGLVAMIGVNF